MSPGGQNRGLQAVSNYGKVDQILVLSGGKAINYRVASRGQGGQNICVANSVKSWQGGQNIGLQAVLNWDKVETIYPCNNCLLGARCIASNKWWQGGQYIWL